MSLQSKTRDNIPHRPDKADEIHVKTCWCVRPFLSECRCTCRSRPTCRCPIILITVTNSDGVMVMCFPMYHSDLNFSDLGLSLIIADVIFCHDPDYTCTCRVSVYQLCAYVEVHVDVRWFSLSKTYNVLLGGLPHRCDQSENVVPMHTASLSLVM